MAARDDFSILLVSDNPEEGAALRKLIKPMFPCFFISQSEEDAIQLIVKERIDILLMGLSTLQANEACFLHLISNKDAGISSIIKRKFLLCGKSEIRDAFSICNKEIFDDYFITRPLYDPYHILIRLRFLMRLFKDKVDQTSLLALIQGSSVEDLSNYFEKVVHVGESVSLTNQEQLQRFLSAVITAVQYLQKGVAEGDMSKSQKNILMSLIEQHTERPLMSEVEFQKQQQRQLSYQLHDMTEAAQLKKQYINNPQPVSLENINVLLVEDDRHSQEAIADVLLKHQSNLTVTAKATEAVHLVAEHLPHIMLLDLTLPDMTPFFVINKVREKNQQTKIILLARPVDRSNVEECLKAGANGVLIKPVDSQLLVHRIIRILNAKSTKKPSSA